MLKGSGEGEVKRHHSDGFILMYYLGCTLMMESGKRGSEGESDLLSLCAPLAGHLIGILRELSSVSEENFTVFGLSLHLSLNLQLNIMVSVPYFCHVFDSYDL